MTPPRRAERGLVVRGAVSRSEDAMLDERVRLHRLELQSTITSVSPVAVDLAIQAGISLDEVARMLPVPRRTPLAAVASGSRSRGAGATPVARPQPSAPQVSRSTGLRLGAAGVAIRGVEDPRGDLGFVPERGVLEAVSRIGRVTVHTSDGTGFVVTSDVLPEGVLCALEGRPVEDAIRHPALDGRGYVIASAFADEFVGGSLLTFRTGVVPLDLPWADLLERTFGHRASGKEACASPRHRRAARP